MTYVMVDVEADGPIPGDYSMISLGAVVVEPGLRRSFGRKLAPISDKWDPKALSISGHTREETLAFPSPSLSMAAFGEWLKHIPNPKFISDNNGFDWMFICWYFHHFTGGCPFGFSSTNLGSLYKGLVKDMSLNFKHLRDAPHNHDPISDAMGNAEAFLKMRSMGLRTRA